MSETTNRKVAASFSDDASRLARIVSARIRADANVLIHQWHHPEETRTRHFVIDNLLPGKLIEAIYEAFPQNASIWIPRQSFRERKKTFAKLERIDPIIGAITDAFHSNAVLQAVKSVTNIDGLEADPELYAGGISIMGRGDFLNPHIDNSHDASRQRYRRLNLLYYITPDWKLDSGGNFELWDDRVKNPKVIVSQYNRLVVMETNRISWHSVSPVQVDRNRCCISNYYFSKNSPEQRHYYHVTSFTGRPHQKTVRLWARIDNFTRQWIAVNLKITRGKTLSRYN
jgi:Rps23 Pro-64 3,4-dihydroxylase Tpa1-like proline 4-hydroxylase